MVRMPPYLLEFVRRIAGSLRRVGLISAGALFALAGCASETLFRSSFDSNRIGMPPSAMQTTGTVQVEGAPGSVVIVDSVPNSVPSNKRWAQISVPNNQAPISALQCNFASTYAEGNYGFLGVLFIPSGRAVASVEFDTGPSSSQPSTSFLHLDFLRSGDVRFDNDRTETALGRFPHDEYFTLSVRIDVTSVGASAYVTLFGTGASRRPVFHNIQRSGLARQYGAIRLSMEYPGTGSFAATDLIVTRKR
jgi:hypothetical protein